MRLNRFITMIISGVAMLLFLAASTGVSVVKHYCHHCGEKTVVTGFSAETHAHSHPCCSEEGCHSEGTHSEAEIEGCCNIEMNLLKVTNYIPEMPKSIDREIILTPVIFQNITPSVPEKTVFTAFTGQEKYGGRSIVTSHRQLII